MNIRVDYDLFAEACTARQALTHITDKWTVLLLMALAEKPYRFGELGRKVECISRKMLTQSLRKLEASGLVSRRIGHGKGKIIQVYYSLTLLGETLISPLAHLQHWAIEHGDELGKRQVNEENTTRTE